MRLSACNDMACVLDRKLSGFNCSTSGLAAVPRVHAKQQAFQAAAHRSSRRAHQTPRQPSQCIATRWPLAVVRSAAGQQQDWQHLDPDDEPGLPWSVESLITLMEKFVSSGLVADALPEADWLLAASVASASTLSVGQLVRLLEAASALDLDITAWAASAAWLKGSLQGQRSMSGSCGEEPWVTYMLRESQNAFEGALPSELLDLLTIVLRLQQQLLLQHAEQDLDLEDAVLLVPDGAWLAKAILRLASGTDGLSAPAAAGAVIVITELLAVTPSPVDPGPWLDVLLLRMAGSDAISIPPSDMVTCAYLVAATHKHMPPQPYVQAMFGDEGGVTYKVDWEPEEAVVLAIASASFRCVPDLLWAKQIQMQTYPGLRDMPAVLLAELAWALAYWQSAKPGTSRQRFDYRPPPSWWDEWFQATAPLLRSAPPASCIRLIWAAAMLELRPPEPWMLQLVSTVYLHLQAGQHDPLELLYLTKAADLWWIQLLDSFNAVAAANRAPPVDPHSPAGASGLASSSGGGGGSGSGVGETYTSVVMCGCPEVYEPPDQLSLLVQDAYDCLSKVSMPPLYWALDIRLVPPYALPLSAGETADLSRDAAKGPEGSAGGATWQQNMATKIVYGPMPPPNKT